jgi:hypothetical protein
MIIAVSSLRAMGFEEPSLKSPRKPGTKKGCG